MSLAAAGGRRAWSRTKSDVSTLVVHRVPVRNGERRGSKIETGGVDAPGEGNIGGGMERFGALTTWWWPYATGWSSRYLVTVSVIRTTAQWWVCPGGPRVGQERAFGLWVADHGELRKVDGDVLRTQLSAKSDFVFFCKSTQN